MKSFSSKVIHLAPGDTLPEYKKLRAVPDRYIDDIRVLISKLNMSTQPNAQLLGLKQIYAFVSRFNKEFVSTFTTCQKGCHSCCYIDVQLTPLEAEYIAQSSNIPDQNSSFTNGHESPCPFLSEKGTCSIYNYRPLVCRTYHVLSAPELCKDLDADVMQYGTHSSNMSNFIYKTAVEWIFLQTHHNFGKVELRDIRNFFPYLRENVQGHLKLNPARAPC